MIVGVLALQGDFAEHITMLESLGVQTKAVRTIADMKNIDGLVIPGGESTVVSKLLTSTGLRNEIKIYDKPVLATCAGAILVSTKIVDNGDVEPLALMDFTIQRNAYGRQSHSIRTTIQLNGADIASAFIRAPKITAVGSGVEVLSEYDNNPVLIKQGNKLAATFHPEVTGDASVHELFLGFTDSHTVNLIHQST